MNGKRGWGEVGTNELFEEIYKIKDKSQKGPKQVLTYYI